MTSLWILNTSIYTLFFARSLTMNAITKSLIPCSEKEADDGFEFSNEKKCEDCGESIAETQHCTTAKDIETKAHFLQAFARRKTKKLNIWSPSLVK